MVQHAADVDRRAIVTKGTMMTPAIRGTILLLLAAAAPLQAAPPSRLPGRVGACTITTIRSVSSRLEDGAGKAVPGSGSAVTLANGVYGVSYDRVSAVDQSRRGDRALTCLVRLPTNCPPHDKRGRWYTTTNLRTLTSWTLPDSEHMCGGA